MKVTITSLANIDIIIHNSTVLVIIDKATNVEIINNLSASVSKNVPILVTMFCDLAIYPSNKSDNAPKLNNIKHINIYFSVNSSKNIIGEIIILKIDRKLGMYLIIFIDLNSVFY